MCQGGRYLGSELDTVHSSGKGDSPKNGQFPISLRYFMTTDLWEAAKSYRGHCYELPGANKRGKGRVLRCGRPLG